VSAFQRLEVYWFEYPWRLSGICLLLSSHHSITANPFCICASGNQEKLKPKLNKKKSQRINIGHRN
jgi:hypothetical protein